MNPSLTQHLDAIDRRLRETVLPLIPADADFAQEQAEFILMSLRLVRDALPHAYRYAVVEHGAYRTALEALAAVSDVDDAPTLAPMCRSDEAQVPLAVLEEHTRRLKAEVSARYARHERDGGATADAARAIMHGLALDQLVRERALFAPTGLVRSERTLGDVLDAASDTASRA